MGRSKCTFGSCCSTTCCMAPLLFPSGCFWLYCCHCCIGYK